MTPNAKPEPVPEGYGTVTPWIVSQGAAGLLDFLVQAFDAEVLGRVEHEDGSIGHAEVRIGDSVVMTFDGRPEWGETPAFLRLYVEDGDTVFRQALAAGATVVTELTELPWGDRVGRVRDPFGNVWWIQQRLAELTPEEIGARVTQPEFVEAMRYVQSARLVEPE
jgi:PhnB protein